MLSCECVASWQFTCVGHGGGRKWGSIADTVKLTSPCMKQENEKTLSIYKCDEIVWRKGEGKNQLIDKRSNSDGPKSTRKGLGNESTEKRGEASGSTIDCENVGGRYQWHVQHLSQVTYQVSIETSYCKSITEFISCTFTHIQQTQYLPQHSQRT